MGEVYRADDLTLDQPIAIKFLPPAYSQNEDLLERFRNEVKIARKVSHPNVCRVYDVGETDGLTFLTMEYVDGEDLSILLRRIGRLPEDKALEIARQVCAGLAAAHAKGVLHRDLKPANVMLDGRGQAVIMDFGLAAIVEQVKDAEIRSGTPAYMAPEQLEGKEVTTRLPQRSVPWLVTLSFITLFTALESSNRPPGLVSVILAIALYTVAAFAVTRFGLLALMVAVVVANGMLNIPLTANLTAWYATSIYVGPVLLIAFTFWAFRTSLGGRKLLPEPRD